MTSLLPQATANKILHVTDARYLHRYKLWIAFNDGASGVVDLGDKLDGPVFAPLKDLSLFAQLRFNELLQTIVWPNGADLAPEFLRELLDPM